MPEPRGHDAVGLGPLSVDLILRLRDVPGSRRRIDGRPRQPIRPAETAGVAPEIGRPTARRRRYGATEPLPSVSGSSWGILAIVSIILDVPTLPAPHPDHSADRFVTGFCDGVVTENAVRKPLADKHLKWAALDSNQRLPPCEDGTLTAELAARKRGIRPEERPSRFRIPTLRI
jgi:hypothetical protein